MKKKSVYEEKREKLGIHKLHHDEQKKLFNEFVQIGGEVVDLQPDEKSHLNEKLEEWIRQKELEYKKKVAEELGKEKTHYKTTRENKDSYERTEPVKNKVSSSTPKRKKDDNPTPYFFSRLASKITCILYGIFPIFKRGFTKSFMELTFYKLQTGLLDAQQILFTIFQTDPKVTNRIRNFLLKAGYTYYFELVYRFYLLYDEILFSKLFETTDDYDNPVFRSKPHFIELFKRILSIHRYYTTLDKAFLKLLEEEKRICNLDIKLTDMRFEKLKDISKFVFEKYFPKLLHLIDFYYKDEIFQMEKPRNFKDFLNVTEKDMLGYWNRYWEEEEKKLKIKEEKPKETPPVIEETANKKINQSILEGIELINNSIDFAGILNFYSSIKDPRMLLSFNDKVFITWVLLEYFDKFYSPIFASNSIIYQVTFNAGQRVDIRGNLKDLYYEINTNYKNFKEYLTIVGELNKTASSTIVGSKELFSLSQKLEMQRAQISKKIRTDVAIEMKKIMDNLEMVFVDYNFEKKIILNPEEIIPLEVNFCGKKHNINKKVIDLFKEAYNFVSAFHFMLNDGDLSGTLLSVIKPKYLSFGEKKLEEKNETVQA